MIKITYEFFTDGDFDLRTPEDHGCLLIDDCYFYGETSISVDNKMLERYKAKAFLHKLLCNGIKVLYTHYWLLKDFYSMIDTLTDFIDKFGPESDVRMLGQTLSGNYDGTYIKVEFLKDDSQNV